MLLVDVFRIAFLLGVRGGELSGHQSHLRFSLFIASAVVLVTVCLGAVPTLPKGIYRC